MRVLASSDRRTTPPERTLRFVVPSEERTLGVVPEEERTEEERLERLFKIDSDRSDLTELLTEELLELLRNPISLPDTDDLLERPLVLRPAVARPLGECV